MGLTIMLMLAMVAAATPVPPAAARVDQAAERAVDQARDAVQEGADEPDVYQAMDRVHEAKREGADPPPAQEGGGLVTGRGVAYSLGVLALLATGGVVVHRWRRYP